MENKDSNKKEKNALNEAFLSRTFPYFVPNYIVFFQETSYSDF